MQIEIIFPGAVTIVSFGETAGWKVESQKDPQGRITGAIWTGGSIAFADRAEFTFEAKNPANATKLEWKVVQISGAAHVRNGRDRKAPDPQVR